MKKRFGMVVAGMTLAVVSFGVFSPAGSALAEDPAIGEVDAPYFYSTDPDMPRWLRYSIIYCAAKTMGIEVEDVKLGLRHGNSLAEIGERVGVRPGVLAEGILRCEHGVLERLVNTTDLSPAEARRIFNFLESHIRQIINWSWDGASDKAS